MAKPGDFPPDHRKAPVSPATPAPEIVPVEDLISDADPTLEWSIADLASDASNRPRSRTPVPAELAGDVAADEILGDAAADIAAEPVFQWTDALEQRENLPGPPTPLPAPIRRETPPPIPPAVLARENGATARRQTPERGAIPTPPLEIAGTGEGSDEELLILETPPLPVPPPAVVSTGAISADARAPKPPIPPPVPPAAGSSSILLPDIPVELVGSVAPGAWPEAVSQRPRKKRLRPWFEEVFDEDYLRTLPFMTADQTLREVGFIKDALSPPADGHVLDVACGYGRHAIELSQRGLRVTGLDLSLPLLIRAADESQRRALSVNFVHADMREMAFDGQFDGAYCVLSSFGYFDEETNLKVATSICRALKPGGRFLLDTLNRDYIVSDLPTRVWWEGDGCVVLEEVDFNFHTSRVIIRRSVVFQDGRQMEQDISIRAYSLHELGKMLRQAGFRVLDVSGSLATKGNFFGATSRNIIMVCERPAT
jgi:SAM-dependent methyltransferase